MTTVIHKHVLELSDKISFEAAHDAKILDIQVQGNEIVLWEMHEAWPCCSYRETILLRVVGTGVNFDADGWTYFKTVQSGSFVWHFFVQKELG